MTRWVTGGIAAALMTGAAGISAAQDTSEARVGANTDWSVFVEGDPKECWAVSAPKETVNTRDGQVVSVRRGDIMMFVTWRPAESVTGDTAEQLRAVSRALASLTPADREVIVLRDIEGLSGDEAAEVLELPLRTMKTRLHRARLRLMAALAEGGSDE